MSGNQDPIGGVQVLAPAPFEDGRGRYIKAYREVDFDPSVGAETNYLQNPKAGTLRGLHWQDATAPEAKLIRCVRGRCYHVAVDIREDSETYLQHTAVELSPENALALYVPPLFAHGMLTLENETDVIYQVSAPYSPDACLGACYDDPALGIDWPRPVELVSDKDRQWALLG